MFHMATFAKAASGWSTVLLLRLLACQAHLHLHPTGSYCGTLDDQAPAHLDFISYDRLHIGISVGGVKVSCQNQKFQWNATTGEIIIMSTGAEAAPCTMSELVVAVKYDSSSNVISVSAMGHDTRLTQQLCHTSSPVVSPAAHTKSQRHKDSSGFGNAYQDEKLIRLPRLNIDPKSVITQGCSHAGDFAHQFHIAFSSLVSGACVFSGQPYHCAVTRFARDYLVPQTNASGVPRCEGCPDDMTLLYDHCKNHPQFVDVGVLPDYVRRSCGQNPIVHKDCIDDPKNLYSARAFLFEPTHDRCYLKGAVANAANLYGQLLQNPENQIKFVNDQPFPHTLPHNDTPYFNHSDPAGYDGPGECLRWVYAPKFGYDSLKWAVDYKKENLFKFNQSEFVDDWGVGLQDEGEIYIPDACKPGEASKRCKLVFGLGFDDNFARYAESNDIVIVAMHVGGHVDRSRFPNACEIQRGLSDVYGQLGSDYSWQSGYHMRTGGRILRRLMGLEGSDTPIVVV
mmetsp:Transcript_70470/g.178246  ORF Transcript_70470/g.178246 Transcript_70470/m.178246 type:complete len:510 (+) Transcript_70470:47-1576(+)